MADNELAAKLARRQVKLEEEMSVSSEDQDSPQKDLNGNEERSSSDVENYDANTGGASDELKNRLTRRQDINDGKQPQTCSVIHRSVYAEFHEFSRKQIKDFTATFKKYDVNCDNFIDFEELKRMMEKLGEPQTHLTLKAMIREVDEDRDEKINLREFLLIFRKAAAGQLQLGSGLGALASLTSVDVTKEGVGGAKNFFEAKIDALTRCSQFEEEIKQEQEQKRQEAEQKRERRANFKANQAVFLK